ncbi:MAG: carbohydrate ABC transporter permease [Treponema sp.]|nr:carbohydrate ABC transporter permease [Treponema sp.]
MYKDERKNQVFLYIIFIIICIASLLPFFLLVITSFSDEETVIRQGYSFIPKKFSLRAYQYLYKELNRIIRSYCISIITTATGTSLGLFVLSLTAYPLSRTELPGRKYLSFYILFTLLFNSGLVPTYLIYTNIFHLKNTIWGLIIPWLFLNGFNVLIARTFFQSQIPSSLIEAAVIDGAGEFAIYLKIILPLSVPVLSTMGLIYLISYWNDWYNGLIFITNPQYYSLQNLLNRILLNVQFLQANPNVPQAAAESLVNNIPLQTVRMALAALGAMPLLLIYPFFQNYLVKGLTVGALKG